MPVNITGGPLSYRYQFEQMYLHWGSKNEHDNGVGSASGSEHAINGHFFPAEIQLYGFNINEIMPSTTHYMTYEGSTTYPGCWETVTWIILNKPIYLGRQEMFELRKLKQGDKVNPKASLSNNRRPLHLLNSRTIRTNIGFSNSPGYK